MKLLFSIFLCFSFSFLRSQTWVSNAPVPTPEELSASLTSGAKTELQKVIAIFQWITDNISYNTRSRLSLRKNAVALYEDEDTSTILRSLTDRVAQNVIKRRVAVCDGYARLFISLCDYAGIKAEIISGYAKNNRSNSSNRFLSNHSWNAVMIDSNWYLLDATWASGYTVYGSNDFVRSYESSYFLTPPRQFIWDHYPDDLFWTLLPDPPTLKEFERTPFKSKAFITNRISKFTPSKGIIEAEIGDTIKIELETEDIPGELFILDAASVDSAFIANAKNDLPKSLIDNNKISTIYTVASPNAQWLHIIYKDEIIMRYRLQVKGQK